MRSYETILNKKRLCLYTLAPALIITSVAMVSSMRIVPSVHAPSLADSTTELAANGAARELACLKPFLPQLA